MASVKASGAECNSDVTLAARFWPKVDKEGPVPAHRPGLGPCWLWTGSLVKGYGMISVAKGPRKWSGVYAHRVSYTINTGPIPEGKLVCHHCDNPRCVNPAHLFLGTAAENIADKVAKGRQRGPVGNRSRRKLTAAAVAEIRRLSISGVRGAELARRFGIARSTVSNIVRVQTWREEAS